MSRPRICLAHRTVTIGDAIGNDILGAAQVLERSGYAVTILAEFAHADIQARYPVVLSRSLAEHAAGADLLVYHHSIHWSDGEALLQAFKGPVIVKYHNITPGRFFAGYADHYLEACDQGREQTVRLAGLKQIIRWQNDSAFNRDEVIAAGVAPEAATVVPPFTCLDGAFRSIPRAPASAAPAPVTALFIGRRAPNKGHVHVLRTLRAWRELFPERPLTCRIVGSVDPGLSRYHEELAELQRTLEVGDSVQWLGHVTDAYLAQSFAECDVYLNLSEHEGFCVPVIEAQAAGVPVISTGCAALQDTLGEDYPALPVPTCDDDYDLIAGFVHRASSPGALRGELVDTGFRNAYTRFTREATERRFMDDVAPILARIGS